MIDNVHTVTRRLEFMIGMLLHKRLFFFVSSDNFLEDEIM